MEWAPRPEGATCPSACLGVDHVCLLTLSWLTRPELPVRSALSMVYHLHTPNLVRTQCAGTGRIRAHETSPWRTRS